MLGTSSLNRIKVVTLVLVVVSLAHISSLLNLTEVSTAIVQPVSTHFKVALGSNIKRKEETLRHVRNQFFPPKIILVWTLMRSGSSFLSSLISALPGVYLSMEPVRQKLGSRFPVNETVEELLNILYSVAVCNPQFIGVSLNYRMDDYCVSMAKERKLFCDTPEFLARMCRRARIHVLKVVTLRLDVMSQFMIEHPDLNVQILHLVRDPRPIHASTEMIASHKANLGEDIRDYNTKKICEDTKKDLLSGAALKQQFPGRYLLVHYEDLAMSPVSTLRGVFKFLGEAYSARLLTTHRRLTYTFNGHFNKRVFGIEKYSKSHAFSWRKEMPFSEIAKIQVSCGEVLDILRLRVFEDEVQCTNMSLDVRLDG